MNVVYFQPKGMNPKYCEVGMIHETDKEHIWYMYEPCKILISEVKIIPSENVFFNKKTQTLAIFWQTLEFEIMSIIIGLCIEREIKYC